jgi:uncharacterized membrane protein YbhN (UPF0104 family)
VRPETPLPVLEALLVCLLLVVVDLYARAVRIQILVRGLGHRLGFWDAFVLNNWGDAACALTPLRLGGEPARLAGMLRSGVPAAAAFMAISLEVLVAWPVVIVAAGWLVWRYAPAWWESAGPRLAEGLVEAWPWVLAVVAASVALWLLVRRAVRAPAVRQVRRPIRRAMVYWRRMPPSVLMATLPLSFVNLATRVAILPVLVLTLAEHPPLGLVAVGSFALLYSQMVLPTPSGAGAVDLGFLSGAAGDLGRHEGLLLLAWRVFTNGIGIVLGVLLAAGAYGRPVLRALSWWRSDRD